MKTNSILRRAFRFDFATTEDRGVAPPTARISKHKT